MAGKFYKLKIIGGVYLLAVVLSILIFWMNAKNYSMFQDLFIIFGGVLTFICFFIGYKLFNLKAVSRTVISLPAIISIVIVIIILGSSINPVKPSDWEKQQTKYNDISNQVTQFLVYGWGIFSIYSLYVFYFSKEKEFFKINASNKLKKV